MKPGLKRAVWIVNSLGFAFYLLWLATMTDKQILREQDGILYFLPVIPFFFVYMLLVDPKPKPAQSTSHAHGHEEGHDSH